MFVQSGFRHPVVAASPLCARATEAATLLAKARPSPVVFYQTNEPIYAQGDAAGGLFLVEFGTVRIARMTEDGRRQISAFHFAGDVFGFEAGNEHQAFAESVDGAGVRTLRPMAADNGFAESALSLAVMNLCRMQEHLMVLGRMTATEKMAGFLLDLHERQGADRFIDLPMQRSDIADYLGLTFETVSRVLRVLKDAGAIRLHRIEQIEVTDPARLASLCG